MIGRVIGVAVLSWILVAPALADMHAPETSQDAARAAPYRPAGTETARKLVDEIVGWICSNFEFVDNGERPAISFASRDALTRMRAADRANWEGLDKAPEEIDPLAQRTVVAIYDRSSRTVVLPDDWAGQSAADQSVLVHEVVHHLQNVSGIKFECPAAREKAAYLAQDKWLARSGTSLEAEFGIDMFTIVVASACM